MCHLWELGGGTMYTNLIETPLVAPQLPDTTVLIIIDLSKPELIWSTLTTLLASVKEYVAASLRTEQAKKLGIAERLAREQAARLGPDHMDAGAVKVFPVPLIILGGMYDTFQNFDPEKKKLICRTLRYIAHSHGATLQFYSTMDTGLVKKVNKQNVRFFLLIFSSYWTIYTCD